jgi:peptidoglycan/LPS O-acetylase OafA/YrhL
MLVVLHHLGSALGSPKYFGVAWLEVPFVAGDAGVEFFFVLSGFIITWAHFRDIGNRRALIHYVRRRIARIYPAYWLVFCVVFIAAYASTSLRATLPHDGVSLLKSLLLLPQDPAEVGGNGAPVIIVAWSLQYEICFYALFAIFIVSRNLGILLCIGALLNIGACRFTECNFTRTFLADNLMLLFGLGVTAAWFCRGKARMPRPIAVAALAALAFFSLGAVEAAAGTQFLSIDRRLAYGVISAVLIVALVQSEMRGQLKLTRRWPLLLGDSSYSLYLIHYPLISLFCKCLTYIGFAGTVGAYVAYPLILTICIAAAIVFHLAVEKPMTRFLARERWGTPLPGVP